MFKRVEKRRRRAEEEEELGIDEEMKQVLGIQDTDSEESDSDSDDGGSSGNGEEEHDEDEDVDFPELHFAGSDAEADDDMEDEDEDEDLPRSNANGLPSFLVKLSIAQALKEPIIPAPEDPNLNFCIFCPQKTLRSETMVQVHRSSNAHKRRLNQFIKFSKGVDPSEEALSIIEEHMSSEQPTFVKPPQVEGGKSKRALKKEASQALRKEKRQKAKEKAKAKKLAGSSEPKETVIEKSDKPKKDSKSDAPKKSNGKAKTKANPDASSPPSKKKRRVEKYDEPAPSARLPSSGLKAREKNLTGKTKETAKLENRVSPDPTPASPVRPSPKSNAANTTADNGAAPSIKNIARTASNRAKAALGKSGKSRKVKA
ncbi:hypothetical protein DFP72DRAFT_120197 [Ephemerocybe angulata]|uniref:Uncharacterized protein n=1 Tax=Ephemerocybe angulata TaxID=980116 RepID=A0A8H6M8L7_9AGAR|nr:hypothetical protein DFP72DRAFT_120197 [Tulosesus angulatus]